VGHSFDVSPARSEARFFALCSTIGRIRSRLIKTAAFFPIRGNGLHVLVDRFRQREPRLKQTTACASETHGSAVRFVVAFQAGDQNAQQGEKKRTDIAYFVEVKRGEYKFFFEVGVPKAPRICIDGIVNSPMSNVSISETWSILIVGVECERTLFVQSPGPHAP
jgi:hypothetical protein